ncbi:MAG: hypothetical protein KAR20_06175 [Candidatus Heimdallarchaeota archaeon]|nr:hypothetical protein [Candidatus Heimdallarchaeota archaeon]
MWNPFKERSRDERIEEAVTKIIHIICHDEIINFKHIEQAEILKRLFHTLKKKKFKERQIASKLAKTIGEAIKEIKNIQ